MKTKPIRHKREMMTGSSDLYRHACRAGRFAEDEKSCCTLRWSTVTCPECLKLKPKRVIVKA